PSALAAADNEHRMPSITADRSALRMWFPLSVSAGSRSPGSDASQAAARRHAGVNRSRSSASPIPSRIQKCRLYQFGDALELDLLRRGVRCSRSLNGRPRGACAMLSIPDYRCVLGRKGWSIVLLLCCAAVARPATGGERHDQPLEIRTLSNRADLVSGGDVLVEIVLPRRTRPDAVQVELNGRDIRHEFAVRADGRFLALLKRLSLGKNKLVASV